MEKRTPTYDLSAILDAARRKKLKVTRSAALGAMALGIDYDGICKVVAGLSRRDFYKSMTTYADHAVWQDVYHGECQGVALYLKFMIDEAGYLVVSFKEQ